ncbi:vacuolar membrane PQ loop repeat protein [Blastomyces gilchristii SLH14081]|uniref:Vacuolar membrane PQ loop repeat protein n=1 Tax=Blastomyces gilchristii (strain SLH14081) TaxID=559298 RepID=A0A179UGC0_BLAGS|nr:vacuolar membrane PQ loop repeat protein [Blastomyces gilchristii SLH14081]OAT06318.1 vacuolar membrane PQ loop repeat protein [Blastomyces gilchristii SLH14081]
MYILAMSGQVDSVPLTPREAASGVLGSISLACWIFLLVPQLIENYKQGSADAVSVAFILVWFIGDIANLIGSLWAQLVPVIIAIAVYFCLADGILICQCIYYNIKNARLEAASSTRKRKYGNDHRRTLSGGTAVDDSDAESDAPDPTTPLLSRRMSENLGISASASSAARRRPSSASRRRHSQHHVQDSLTKILEETEPRNAWVKNSLSVFGICAAGAAGWAIAWQSGVWQPTTREQPGNMAVGAQVFGYLSAVCYLGARIPQILKNYREKSCEGLSLLFFIFSLMGNLSYGAGILFHSTEKGYFLKNLPWLIGSLGTMVEDAVIFAQFRIYAVQRADSSSSAVI